MPSASLALDDPTNQASNPQDHHQPPSAPPSPLAKRSRTELDPAALTTSTAPSEMTSSSPVTTHVEQSPPLLVKKLSEKARTPTRGSEHAAGYDLYSVSDTIIGARGKGFVDTDLSIAVPAGTYGRVAPRSGLASKQHIDVGAGVIDADYRGPVKVLLFNHGENDFKVSVGDRVAQLIIERIYNPDVVVVEELEASVRGTGGFGSTG